jgi:hypothetical protein
VVVWAAFLLVSVGMVGAGLGRAVGGAAVLAVQVSPTSTSADASAMAIDSLMAQGFTRAQAEELVDETHQAMRPGARGGTPGQLEAQQAHREEATEKAIAAGAAASWIGFGIALLSLLGGASGGMLGAIGEQKVLGELARKQEEQAIKAAPPPSGPVTTPGA